MSDAHAAGKNRLAAEKSPYLLQHAANPVDWFPWGAEAFAKARAEDKPIFVSIGYSTCHWCHVMERESFEDPNIAALLNAAFVSVKVDREERPDVDQIYMAAVQAITGSGGWPLNVWLDHDLRPFYGGTYFPPERTYGRAAFREVLESLAKAWKEDRERLGRSAGEVAAMLERHLGGPGDPVGDAAPDALERAGRALLSTFDERHGGFGPAPKFPRPVELNLLLRRWARSGAKDERDAALFTLREMAAGGLHDQLGGGFHRYSVDDRWRVPHFEKMLYDQAQLASSYVEAWQITGDEAYARVARDVFAYVARDLRHPDGGFFSAEDADSLNPDLGRKTEGWFYLWSIEEVRALLGADAGAFIERWGLEPGGNTLDDPHGEFDSKNVLYAARAPKDAAEAARLDAAAAKLLAARVKRPRPGLDDKVLASWNGLMISAFARGAFAFDDAALLETGLAAGRFLRQRLWDAKTKTLYRRWREGERAIPGFLDDYAGAAQAALDLYEASHDPAWLEWSLELGVQTVRRFYDAENGGFFTAAAAGPDLLTRAKDSYDGAEPAGNSVAVLTLLRLHQYTRDRALRDAAEHTLAAFASALSERGRAVPQLLVALDYARAKPRQILIAGEPGAADTRTLLAEVRRRFLPGAVLVVAGAKAKPALARRLPVLETMDRVGGKATAYVCYDYACELPTADAATLGRLLEEKR